MSDKNNITLFFENLSDHNLNLVLKDILSIQKEGSYENKLAFHSTLNEMYETIFKKQVDKISLYSIVEKNTLIEFAKRNIKQENDNNNGNNHSSLDSFKTYKFNEYLKIFFGKQTWINDKFLELIRYSKSEGKNIIVIDEERSFFYKEKFKKYLSSENIPLFANIEDFKTKGHKNSKNKEDNLLFIPDLISFLNWNQGEDILKIIQEFQNSYTITIGIIKNGIGINYIFEKFEDRLINLGLNNDARVEVKHELSKTYCNFNELKDEIFKLNNR